MFKFEKLKTALLNNKDETILLNEEQLNQLIDGGLPPNAFINRSYFSNDPTHSIFKAWYECGYVCTRVDRKNKYIVLTKVNPKLSPIISSDLLFVYFKGDVLPKYNLIISPFSFAEFFRKYRIDQNDLIAYLQKASCKYIDTVGNVVTFNEFYDIQNNFISRGQKLIYRMESTYQDFVRYVLATCIVNAVNDANEVVDYFSFKSNLPVIYFDDLMNKYSLTKLFNNTINEFENICNLKCIQESIKKIDIKTVSRFLLTSCTPLELRFYDYAFDNFINIYKETGTIDISPKLVEEMLNVSLLSRCKQYSYKTNQSFTGEILYGSIKSRIMVE